MDLSSFTQQLSALASSGPDAISESERSDMLQACIKVQNALENPLDKLLRIMLGINDAAALRIGVDMGLFDVAVSKQAPVTVVELAAKRNADPDLVRRVVRLLAAHELFTEVDVDTYTATPSAATYVAGSLLGDTIVHMFTDAKSVAVLPEYLEKTGYKNPDDALDGPWQLAHDAVGQHYFDWLETQPRYQGIFNKVMAVQQMIHGTHWFDMYPVEENLSISSSNRVAFVDVGGGLGHDIIAFHERFPELNGRLILEDLPSVVQSITELPSKIERVGHDFFKPQPDIVRGAKVFYLRHILHDWPDKQSTIILSHVRDAMAEDSILIINEAILPDRGVSHHEARMDFLVLAFFASLQRTEKQWRNLLEASGFEITGIYEGEQVGRSLRWIEAVVKK